MTITSVPVEVLWTSPEEGGRKAIPQGNRYVTVSRFEEDRETWQKEAWSIVLEFPTSPEIQGNPARGQASFLSATAPQDRLRPGCIFELFEGPRKVATVKVLSSPR